MECLHVFSFIVHRGSPGVGGSKPLIQEVEKKLPTKQELRARYGRTLKKCFKYKSTKHECK